MMTVFRWNGTARLCESLTDKTLPEKAAELDKDSILWIDLSEPTVEEEQRIFERFLPIHPLTLADIRKPRDQADHTAHLPKAEEFVDYVFVVSNPLPRRLAQGADNETPKTPENGRSHRPQLSAVLTHTILITHHDEPLTCVETVHGYLERHGASTQRGPDFLFHILLEAMVDEYAPVIDRILAKLDHLEPRIFRDPSPAILQHIIRLKRQVTTMRKTLNMEREVLARLIRGEFLLVDEREIVYYRNVYDHLIRYSALVESARETISDLMQTHLAASSNRLNEVMKLLAMISTIILPMTLIAGIYGMNFEQNVWPDFKSAPWGFPFAIGLMMLTGLGSYLIFRWRRWV